MKLIIYFSAEGIATSGHYRKKLIARRAIINTLAYENFNFDTEVSLTFCDNESIQMKNAEFRSKNCATDVLSFPMYERDELLSPDSEPVMLGDIVISLDRALEQATALGHSLEREIAFLCIHSILHLLGYDHERSEEEEELMCQKQRDIIDLMYKDKDLKEESFS